MAKWNLIGQIGNVIKKEDNYIVNIAVNKYKPPKDKNKSQKWEKAATIWFTCFSEFEPKVEKGDRVMVEGSFVPSNIETVPFGLKIEHIAVIPK